MERRWREEIGHEEDEEKSVNRKLNPRIYSSARRERETEWLSIKKTHLSLVRPPFIASLFIHCYDFTDRGETGSDFMGENVFWSSYSSTKSNETWLFFTVANKSATSTRHVPGRLSPHHRPLLSSLSTFCPPCRHSSLLIICLLASFRSCSSFVLI